MSADWPDDQLPDFSRWGWRSLLVGFELFLGIAVGLALLLLVLIGVELVREYLPGPDVRPVLLLAPGPENPAAAFRDRPGGHPASGGHPMPRVK